MSETMKAIRQKKAGGELNLESIPIPLPGPGEVLVKMAAAPINPSDLASISDGYMKQSWPFTPGLEGSGTIVKAGSGFLPRMRLGKKVACSPPEGGDGTWAEYMLTKVMKTVPLPSGTGMEQGSMMLVNPMTVMAFIKVAKEGKHKALVNNAAASSLGKMMIRMAAENALPLINIVRNEKHVALLKNLGATHVLCSSNTSFLSELRSLSEKLEATLILDAVGGKGSADLLSAAPRGSKLLAYARLSGEFIQADPLDLIRMEKSISGFQLGNWLKTKNITYKLSFLSGVKSQLSAALSSEINQTFSLEEHARAINLYRENMSAGKILLLP